MGLAGIIFSLVLLMYLAYRGISVLVLAPLLAILAVLFSGDTPLFATYTQVFMPALGKYLIQYFPVFMLGAIFGKLMDDSGSARVIAHRIVEYTGARRAILAIVLACAILTYGGVSLFVVAFAVFPIAVAMAGGDVLLEGGRAELLDTALDVISRTGAEVQRLNSGIRVMRNGAGIAPVDVTTEPFPGFPTDLQAQFMGLMTMAKGRSKITETIFENRFMHVQELARLGAHINLSGQTAIVDGVPRLKGAPVMATDLRASVSLVIAGLAAEGETTVNRVYHLDRGFERLEEKLSGCGAVIERISA